MKFGGGYNRYTKNQQLFGNTNGYFNFSDGWTDQRRTDHASLTGDSYLDFLLGLSTSYSQLADAGYPALRQPDDLCLCRWTTGTE